MITTPDYIRFARRAMRASTAWVTLRTFDTMAPCRQYLASSVRDSEGGLLWFKANKKNPGDGRTRSNYMCAAHVDCRVQARAVLTNLGFQAQVSEDSHSQVKSTKKRKNSGLSVEQEREVERLMSAGVRPGAMRSSMTEEALKHKDMMDPMEKRPEGGIQGKPMSLQSHACHEVKHEKG